jgi:hypothetical protein
LYHYAYKLDVLEVYSKNGVGRPLFHLIATLKNERKYSTEKAKAT